MESGHLFTPRVGPNLCFLNAVQNPTSELLKGVLSEMGFQTESDQQWAKNNLKFVVFADDYPIHTNIHYFNKLYEWKMKFIAALTAHDVLSSEISLYRDMFHPVIREEGKEWNSGPLFHRAICFGGLDSKLSFGGENIFNITLSQRNWVNKCQMEPFSNRRIGMK